MIRLSQAVVAIQNVDVLRQFSITVEPGSLVGLVGRNGAGKTSVMRTIMGHLALREGTLHFGDVDLSTLASHERAALGIGYMPEDRGLVPELTVEENICLPLWVSPSLRVSERLELVYSVLPELVEMRTRKALLLSGGQQKLVALAWPAHWRWARACCCWTNPSRAWHPPCRKGSRRSWGKCAAAVSRY